LSSPPPENAPRPRRRFKNYILDWRLQLRYVLVVTVVSVVVAALLGLFIWYQKSFATQTIVQGLNSANWIDDAMKQEISRTLERGDRTIVLRMAGIGVGIFAILTLFLFVFTHKVAGPLHKISLDMDDMREGSLSPTIDLREGDYLASFFQRFKAMHDAVRARAARDVEVYGRFLDACGEVDPASDLGKGVEGLRVLRAEKQKSLE
jgi:hypothetical protein